MNTKGLAKHYELLTPLERLPLIMAAVERVDSAEADRLARSAPRIQVRLPDYHGLGEGLLLLTLFHAVGQLELGLLHGYAAGLAAQWEQLASGKDDKTRAERLWSSARLLAYRLCVEANGWKLLCRDLHIDPETLLRDLPCHDTLRRTEETARLLSFTAEEAAAHLRRLGEADAGPATAEDAARAMREFIDRRVHWWG